MKQIRRILLFCALVALPACLTSDDDDATANDDDLGDDDDATSDDDDATADDDDSTMDDDDSASGDDDDSAAGGPTAFVLCASGGEASSPSGVIAVICTGPVTTGAQHTSTSGSFTLHSGPITRIAP